MTDAATPEKPRRRWRLATAVACLVPVGGCVALGFATNVRLSRQKAQAKADAQPLIAALDARMKEAGTCPERLEPALLASSQAKRFTYRCIGSEKRYLLACDDHSSLGLPSDLVHQFDSRTRDWSMVDVSQAEAFQGPAPR